MSVVNNNTQTQSAPSSTQISSNGKTDAAGLSSMFLELLVAQISHQNPLNPMDGTQYVSQLAEFSSVESLENLNIQASSQLKYMQSLQALEATSLVGQRVDVQADTQILEKDGSVSGAINLGAEVDYVTFRLYSQDGQLVGEQHMQQPGIGTFRFEFKGQSAGAYRVEAEVQAGQSRQKAPLYLTSTVERVSVGQGPDDIILQLDGLGNHYLFDINQLTKSTQS